MAEGFKVISDDWLPILLLHPSGLHIYIERVLFERVCEHQWRSIASALEDAVVEGVTGCKTIEITEDEFVHKGHKAYSYIAKVI